MKGVFITGSDTGIGKTLISAGLVNALASRGVRVVGMKPVVAGAVEGVGGVFHWEDLLALEASGGLDLPIDVRAAYRLHLPCSPDFAAKESGQQIQVEPILHTLQQANQVADYAVVEGVGGVLVPLGPSLDVATLIQALGFPVVVVVGIRLGCINHAILTAEALRQRGLMMMGWIANRCDPDFVFADSSIESIAKALGPPLAEVPFVSETYPLPARAHQIGLHLGLLADQIC